jgi:uncharacterized protein (TIGR00369 family)
MGHHGGMTENSRTRTITWEDPMIGAAAMTTMSGLDYMLALKAGEVPPPPIIALMNMTLESVEAGRVTFLAQPDESHYNPIGAVHGGFACTVLDSVAGCAVQTTLPHGYGYTSLEIKVNYLAGLSTTTGPLTAIGTVVKPGKRVAFAEGTITDSSGKVVATASSTLLVFPLVTPGG